MTPKILRPATICKDTERHKVKSDKAVYPMRRCAPAMRDGVALSGNELSARSCRGARDAGKGARHIKKWRIVINLCLSVDVAEAEDEKFCIVDTVEFSPERLDFRID